MSNNKTVKPYTLTDSYKDYRANCKAEEKDYVSLTAYRNINYDFNKAVVSSILKEAWEFTLPFKLGTLRIKKVKMNLDRIRVDRRATRENKSVTYFFNDHSDGYYYKWFWYKCFPLKNIANYKFYPTFHNRRSLVTYIKEHKMDYPT